MTDDGWGAGWSREALIENGVRLAELGFGIIRVYHPLDASTCACGNASCGRNVGKHPIGNDWNRTAEHDPERVRTLLGNPGNRSFGIIPPAGVFAWDVDGDAPARLRELSRTLGPLPATRVHRSGSGKHAFYRWPASVPGGSGNLFGIVTRWGEPTPAMVVGPGSIHATTGTVYAVESDVDIAELPETWARAAAAWSDDARQSQDAAEPGDPDWKVGKDHRHDFLKYRAARLRAVGLRGAALADALLSLNAERCDPPKDEAEVRDLAHYYDGKADVPPGVTITGLAPAGEPTMQVNAIDRGAAAEWPAGPIDAAYHGLAGEIALAVAEQTEPDPAGILAALLATFGAAAGHHRYLYQGAAQAANLFVVLVGESASGRKGTTNSIVGQVFDAAYPGWREIVVPGLGSGEGLVGHLKRHDGSDPKVPAEHRALVYETELGRLLAVMGREGSTLSPVLRDAWDGSPLGRHLAREDQLVTWHHVGLLGHITPAELRAKLTGLDAANGFGNRFLWMAVRRTRLVALPADVRQLVAEHVRPLHEAIIEAQAPGELRWTAEAEARWRDLYADLAGRPRLGLAGAISARAEAQIARLALTYALLDRSAAIEVAHLDAARALWGYAERSAQYLFGQSTGNRDADLVLRILRAEGVVDRLRMRDETGLRRGADLDQIEAVLVDAGLAELVALTRTDGAKGRPKRALRMRDLSGLSGLSGTEPAPAQAAKAEHDIPALSALRKTPHTMREAARGATALSALSALSPSTPADGTAAPPHAAAAPPHAAAQARYGAAAAMADAASGTDRRTPHALISAANGAAAIPSDDLVAEAERIFGDDLAPVTPWDNTAMVARPRGDA